MSPDEYQANKLIRKAVERTLHTAIEASLDNALVYGILSRRLGDFDEFARAVVAYLERR